MISHVWSNGNYNFSRINSLWIGLSVEQGEWEWIDGNPLSFQGWAEGSMADNQREDACAVINNAAHYMWHETDCNTRHAYICENPAGIK